MQKPSWLDAEELRRAGAELSEMLQLRRELAELEIRADAIALRRLAICLGIGATSLIIGLPTLIRDILP